MRLEQTLSLQKAAAEQANASMFKKYLNVSEDDEKNDKAIEDLTAENHSLHEQLNLLKAAQRELIAPDEHQRVKDALKAQEQGNKRLTIEKKELVKMFDTLSS